MGGLISRSLRDPLVRNSAALVLNSSLTAATGFIFWIVVARLYAPFQVGLAAALMASLVLIYNWSNLGLSFGLMRFLPSMEDKKKAINTCLTVTAACAGVVALLFVLSMPLWSSPLENLRQHITWVGGFVLFAIAAALFSSLKYVFVALQAAELALFPQAFFAFSRLALPVALLSLGAMGIFASYGLALVVALLTGFLVLAWRLPGYVPLPSFYKGVIRAIGHFSFSSFVAEGVGNLPVYLLPLVVVTVLGTEANAYFYTAYVVGSILLMFPLGVTTALLPEGARNQGQLGKNTAKALRLILLTQIPAVGLVLLLADKLLLLFGTSYSVEASGTLRLLALASIPMGLTEVWVVVKRVQLQLKKVILCYSAVAVAILGISYPLMRVYGIEGVGWAWLLGETTVAALLWGGEGLARGKALLPGRGR